MVPSPGSCTDERRSPVARSCTLSSLTACRVQATSSTPVVAQLGAVQDGEVLEHGLLVLRHQVDPVLVRRVGRVDDGQPAARGVAVGRDVGPAVAADEERGVRVDTALHLDERRLLRAARRTGRPGRRRCAAPCRSCTTPRASARPRTGARRSSSSGPGRRRTPARPGPGRCRPGAARPGGGTSPRPRAAAPGRAGARSSRPRRRPATRRGSSARGRSGRRRSRPVADVHDPQHRVLAAALGQLVGEQVALLAGLPGVQRRRAGRVDRHRVDEDPLGAVRVDGQQHGVLLGGQPAQQEGPLAAPGRRADDAGAEQLGDPGVQPVPGRPVGARASRTARPAPRSRPGSRSLAASSSQR